MTTSLYDFSNSGLVVTTSILYYLELSASDQQRPERDCPCAGCILHRAYIECCCYCRRWYIKATLVHYQIIIPLFLSQFDFLNGLCGHSYASRLFFDLKKHTLRHQFSLFFSVLLGCLTHIQKFMFMFVYQPWTVITLVFVILLTLFFFR